MTPPRLRTRVPGHRSPVWAAGAALLVAALTLFPTGDALEPLALCLLCGERGLADAILNVFLFVPFGAALALRGVAPARAVLLGAALSGGVEVLQHFVPGRDPSPADLLFNTLGTAAGFAVLRAAPRWLAPPPGGAGRFSGGAVALALGFLLAGGLLLAPALPRAVYYGQWTADLGYLERYRGRVVAASVGDVEVPSHRMERESPRLRSLLQAGAPVRVEAVAGPPPPALAPVFSVYDHLRREVVLVGADREDAVFRYRTLGTALKLDQPDLRVPGAFGGVAAGDPLRLAVYRDGPGYCVQVDDARSCSLGFTVADTWTVLLFPARLPPGGRRLVGLLWLAALFLPAGLRVRGRRQTLATGAAVAAGLLLLPAAAGLLATPPSAVLAALAGMGAGALAARAWPRLV